MLFMMSAPDNMLGYDPYGYNTFVLQKTQESFEAVREEIREQLRKEALQAEQDKQDELRGTGVFKPNAETDRSAAGSLYGTSTMSLLSMNLLM